MSDECLQLLWEFDSVPAVLHNRVLTHFYVHNSDILDIPVKPIPILLPNSMAYIPPALNFNEICLLPLSDLS